MTESAINSRGPTPALRQYLEAKDVYPDTILFFQMGDFYELFLDDAEKVAPLLELTLTSRHKMDGHPVPMCGVPLSAGETYINRLVLMGYKVSVCDQKAAPVPGKGLAERVIRRVVTPGTILSAEGQVPALPRYLTVLYQNQEASEWALAAIEISTGDFILGRWTDLEGLRTELTALEPSELIIPESAPSEIRELVTQSGIFSSTLPDSSFDPESATESLNKLFGAEAVSSWTLGQWPLVLGAAGAALNYCRTIAIGTDPGHLAQPRLLWSSPYLGLDEAAIRNLELTRSMRDGNISGSLLGLLDLTVTPMGSRLTRSWLTRPLMNRQDIENRHGAVEYFLKNSLARSELTLLLKKAYDLERSLSRLTLGRGTVRDLVAIRDTLNLVPGIKDILGKSSSELLLSLGQNLNPNPILSGLLNRTLNDNPPLSEKDGGLVRETISPVLDRLRELEKGGKKEIAALEAQEKKLTGINSLKVGFNRVFGYYLEVSKSYISSVPKEWIRKQTIAGGERYVTAELKEWEEKILTAGEKRAVLEERILETLKAHTAAKAVDLKIMAQILAETDVLASLAGVAERYNWVRPKLTDDDHIEIKAGRHPVVEKSLPPGEPFVTNDVLLSRKERLLIITGPNMAGKSTILRQTAIIVILNQMGSFIPAESAKLSIRDQVFTRVGANDDLARGRSTFMVEMNETARILTQATPKSLVILDEVGRGTSTYDGLSIAWAVAEYLHDLGGRGVPTLFATHYHELVELDKSKPLTRNFNVSVKKWNGRIIFLRKLTPGGVNKSYGLAVAALAGLPAKVISRAQEVLDDLSKNARQFIRTDFSPMDLLATGPEEPAKDLLKQISDINTEELTPLAALNLINELKNKADEVLS